MRKGLFGRKSKDDNLQDELDQAKKEAEAAKKAIKDLMTQNVESKQTKAAAEKRDKEAEEKIAELERKVKDMAEQENKQHMDAERNRILEEKRARVEAAKKPKIITTHTVQPDETLSHIALKYYKRATPPFWKFLLEHNKEVLKGNERNVRAGMELEIPELPDDLNP